VQGARAQFEAVTVDRGITFEREAGFATQALMAQEYTLSTAMKNPQSVVNAVANIAAIGLSLNPAKKQAYLVPRDGRICLDISYIGLLDLAIASGSIRWGQAELVHKADRFVLNGFDKPPTHERDPFSQDRGDIVGAYAVVKTCDGDYLTTTMPIDEILGIRDRSQAWKSKQSGPWKTDPGEMMKKTVIKRAYKLWPKTDRLDAAIHHLNTENEEGLEAIDNEPLEQPRNFGLTPERSKVIRNVAAEALQRFNEGDEFGAYESVAFVEDTEEKLALWSILKPHSALRSAIKRLAAEERKKQEEIEAKEV
jgi:recombination protein RecT